MSWLWGSATNPQYEELVEKACSPINLTYPQSEDIAVNLEITDLIRSKAVQPKPAMQSLKRRIAGKNGRVQMYALGLVDTCIKNGGDHFLAEIASKEFVDEMSGLIRSPLTSAEVKQMALKLFQQWALAFQSKKELAFFVDVYHELKNTGIAFPPPPSQTSAHLLSTTTAPAWIDSDVCMRCRCTFTFTNRKHHCRNCGLVFDQACSSRQMPLPRFGIAEEVRVCEGCWMKAGKGNNTVGSAPVVPGRTPRSREDLDADLQRAIELSLAESQPAGRKYVGSEPPLARKMGIAEDDDEEMRLAIEASLRDMESRPSAPQGAEEPDYKPLPTYDLAPREAETILTFSNTLDQMAAYGERDLRRFPHAHMLYEQAYSLGGKLQRNSEEKSTKQQMLAEMQDKLSQAVGVYGQILDGQQAYAARRMQEQQQRQYQQHMYSYAPPQQPYAPYPAQGYTAPTPYENGHGTPYPAYVPPQQYRAPEQSRAGPSLYPSMPNLAAGPVQNAPHSAYQSQQYRPEASSPVLATQYPSQAYDPSRQWLADPPQSGIERHSSMRAPSMPSQPPLHRNASLTYGTSPPVAEPQGYSVDPPLDPQQYSYPFASKQPTAPPPFDIASHPNSSPTNSIYSILPIAGASQSYPSPAAVPLPMSPGLHTQPYQTVPWQQSSAPQAQPAAQSQQYQQAFQQRQAQQAPQQAAPQVYSVNSFPQAPAAVFPDAPMEAPHGLERKEREEALLIEL